MEPKIKISDYTYTLPEEKIAKYPLPSRDSSKLLIYKNGIISHSIFHDIHKHLPLSSHLIINNTKVIAARLFFKRETGAIIEIFCLEPYSPSEYNMAFTVKGKSLWRCVIGNIKRFKSDTLEIYGDSPELHNTKLTASLVEREDNEAIVEFNWNKEYSFAQVLELCGKIPIPPYLKRDSEESDKSRYQTVYAKDKGSVAAPTAGLHFTEEMFKILEKEKNIRISRISLHVGAGTFIPVKTDMVENHKMHSEPFSISKSLIDDIILNCNKNEIISVGTTSTRTIESLYYLGVRCIEGQNPDFVTQWEPYERVYEYSTVQALKALSDWMDRESKEILEAKTQIIIVPGFKFRITDILVTNFHQPQSTLLLLIAAFIGENWREVYDYALKNDFRFLSYGDSCLFFRI